MLARRPGAAPRGHARSAPRSPPPSVTRDVDRQAAASVLGIRSSSATIALRRSRAATAASCGAANSVLRRTTRMPSFAPAKESRRRTHGGCGRAPRARPRGRGRGRPTRRRARSSARRSLVAQRPLVVDERRPPAPARGGAAQLPAIGPRRTTPAATRIRRSGRSGPSSPERATAVVARAPTVIRPSASAPRVPSRSAAAISSPPRRRADPPRDPPSTAPRRSADRPSPSFGIRRSCRLGRRRGVPSASSRSKRGTPPAGSPQPG